MAYTADGDMAGSVSGGCVEGAVAQTAFEVVKSGKAALLSFTATYQAAWDVGLSCGGQIEVLVQPLELTRYTRERNALLKGKGYSRFMLATRSKEGPIGDTLLVDDEGIFFSSLGEGLTTHAIEAFSQVPLTEVCGSFDLEEDGETLTFSFSRQRTRPQLICIGGTHVSVFLTQIARPLGYATTIIDPRGIFASEKRFPHADILTHEWPQEALQHLTITSETAVCALTHDPKIDVPALEIVVRSPAFYVGSLGRSSTQTQRCQQLGKLGVSDELIGRIYGPIGLDLGGKLPEEIALAIMAEITAVRYGRSATSSRMLDFAKSH
jgi:xanthine dehydrogenase accessory factor